MQPNSPSYAVPFPLSLILCDAVYEDPVSRKKALIGMFSVLMAQGFPVYHPGFCVHLEFSDCQGSIPLKLRIIDADEERAPIFEMALNAQVPDRRAVAAAAFYISGGIVFPEPGEYRIQTFAGDEPLLERRLIVVPFNRPTEAS